MDADPIPSGQKPGYEPEPKCPGAPTRPRRWPLLAWIDGGLIGAGLVLLLALPRNTNGDGAVRYEAIGSLLSGDLPREEYSLVTPLLALPPDLFGRLFGAEAAFAYRFNGIVFAIGLAAIWLILRHDVPGSLIRSFLLVLTFGSMFPASVVSLYGETTTAILLGVGLLAIVAGHTSVGRSIGWVAAVLGAVNTPAILPAFALVVLVLAFARRSPWPLLAIGVAIALSLVDVRLHTGQFTSPYVDDHGLATVMPFSGKPGFSYPTLFGILAIIFSFGKGLIFFAPGLFLGVRDGLARSGKLTRTRVLWLVLVGGMVAVYSRWWAWYGGVFYGPRFFLIASIPASLVIAVRLRPGERSPTAILVSVSALALSLWVGVTSAIGSATPPICTQDDFALEHLCWYTPEFSALWRPLIDFPPVSTSAVVYAGLALGVLLRLSLPVLVAAEPLVPAQLRQLARTLRDGSW